MGFTRSQSLRLHRRKHLGLQPKDEPEEPEEPEEPIFDDFYSDNNSPINMCLADQDYLNGRMEMADELFTFMGNTRLTLAQRPQSPDVNQT